MTTMSTTPITAGTAGIEPMRPRPERDRSASAGPRAPLPSLAQPGFDIGGLRIAAAVAVLFVCGPGTLWGAALLWSIGGGRPWFTLVPASTHAMLQLGGGFMSLIAGFLAFGVPHLLAVRRPRLVLAALALVSLGLAVEVAATVAGVGAGGGVVGDGAVVIDVVVIGRAIGVVGALVATVALGSGVLAARKSGRALWREPPAPLVLLALALHPVAWLAYLAERDVGVFPAIPPGVAADAMLFLVVVPIVLSMGFKMFSAMLQLDTGKPQLFYAALASWLAGGVVVVIARALAALPAAPPHASRVALVLAAPLLLAGVALWLASLHALRQKKRGLALVATAGTELRVHVVVAVASLACAPLLFALSAVFDMPVLVDLARHLVAIGFVLVITMGVSLRALPRFWRGRPSSPWFGLATLALLVVGLVLRAGRAFGAPALVEISSLVTFAAVLAWGAHLARGFFFFSAPAPPPSPRGAR